MNEDLWAISHEDHEDPIEEEKQSLGWMLLMGWILSKSELWKHRSSLRVLSVVQYVSEKPLEEQRLQRLLRDTRIEARTTIVALAESRLPKYQALIQDQHVGENGHPGHPKPDRSFASLSASDRFEIFNEVIASYSSEAGVLFTPLPLPPKLGGDSETTGRNSGVKYLRDLDLLTKDLPPILLTRGVTNVITTDL